jgi:signal transduction histidine kinase/CheY-like chemotaxis protein
VTFASATFTDRRETERAPGWLTRKFEQVLGPDERIRHVRAAALIGISVGFLFSIFNILTVGMLPLGLAELAVVIFLLMPALAISGMPRWGRFSIPLMLLATAVIFGALIVFGGIEGTGLFWVYTVPFVAFFLVGQRRGWWFCFAFLIGATLYLLWIGPKLSFSYQYSPVISVHFLLALGFYVLVAAAFNHIRGRFEEQLRLGKAQAEAAALVKSRFLAAASHDLRQPAHALGMFVARLSQLPNDPQTRELVAGVDASVRALQEMLDAFLDYSRLDSESIQVRPTAFPIADVFSQLRSGFMGMAAEKGLRLRIRRSDAWVTSDPVLLHRVLLNLVSNAIQYTNQGSVLLTCRINGARTHACIQVWDSGIGIAEIHHARIFEEFFQVKNEARDRTKGLGIGLSIVDRLCRVLDHGLSLRSRLGAGTRFAVMVPLASAHVPTLSGPVPELPVANELESLEVLLIEDDELGSAALSGLLRSWGCRVSVAGDAQQACQLLKQSRVPDFVVSDYRLPGGENGFDAVRHLREAAGRDIAACIISGDMDARLGQEALAAGLPLLRKPVRPAKLRSILRHHVQSRNPEAIGLN